MRKLLAIIGTIFIVLGTAGAIGTYFGAIYTDNTNPPRMSCTIINGNEVSCNFATNYASVQEDVNLFQLQMMLSAAGMVTGGALIAGACALRGRERRNPAPAAAPYAGPPSTPYVAPPAST